MKNPRKEKISEHGFVTLMLLGFMPILLSALSIYYLSTTWVHMDLNVHNICRLELLNSTQEVIPDLQWLIGKNLESTELEMEKKNLQLSLMAAPDPFSRSILRARIKMIQSKQYVLNLQQKARIQKANQTLITGMKKAENAVENYLKSHLKKFPFFFSMSNLQITNQNPKLQVRPTTNHTAPNYGTLPQLLLAQKQVLKWTYTLQIRPWLVQRGFHSEYKFDQSCEASIDEKNGGTSWKSVLTKARY